MMLFTILRTFGVCMHRYYQECSHFPLILDAYAACIKLDAQTFH
jgi:hypothetical protein